MRHIFPLRLRFLRLVSDLSLDEAANRIGVDRTTLSRLERGLLEPSDDARTKIEKFYEESWDELILETSRDEHDERPLTNNPVLISEHAESLESALSALEEYSS